MRVRRFYKVSVLDRSAFAVAYLSLIPSTHNPTPLTTALGWLVQSDGPNSPLLAHNVLRLAHPAQHSPLADFSLHRLIPTIYLSLLPLTCIFHGRTRRWHRIPPVSSDQGCFFRPDLPCNHSRRFFPIFSRPLRNAFKSAVNALFTPSELARPLKFLTSPLIRGVVVCEIFREFILQLVYQPLYVRLGALEHGLHTGSDSSQSALIISEVFISVLLLSLAGRFVSVGCRESWPFRPEARTSTSRAFR